jgi:hypothetical protein
MGPGYLANFFKNFPTTAQNHHKVKTTSRKQKKKKFGKPTKILPTTALLMARPASNSALSCKPQKWPKPTQKGPKSEKKNFAQNPQNSPKTVSKPLLAEKTP